MLSMQEETLQRARRIETRLTSFMLAMGVETEARRPEFVDGAVMLPSPHTSIQHIIECVPEGFSGPAQIYVGDRLLGTLIWAET